MVSSANARMQGRQAERAGDTQFERQTALQQQRIDADSAQRQAELQREAQRREQAGRWIAQNAPQLAGAFENGLIPVDDVFKIANPEPVKPTAGIQEYQYAVANDGETRSFTEWKNANSAAGSGEQSAKQEQIARLMETGLDRTQAVGVADGRFVVSRDPMDGTVIVVDKGTGNIVGGSNGQGQTPTPQPQTGTPAAQPAPGSMNEPQDGFTTIDVGRNAEDAFGIEGTLKGAANSVTDALGINQPYPEVEKVTRNFNALNESILSDLANGYQRQPPVIIMKALQELQPRPGETFEGASSAQAKLNALRTSIKTEARAVEASLNRRQTPTNRQEYEKRAAALDAALSRIDAMSGAFGSGESQTTSGGVKWRIVE